MAEDISGNLARRQCVPCRGGLPPLSADRIQALRAQISDGWNVVEGHHLVREIGRKNFLESLKLANSIGEIAESQRHHPDLLVSWGKLTVTLFTHAINGLHENDFILAARIDEFLAAEAPTQPGTGSSPAQAGTGSSPAVPG